VRNSTVWAGMLGVERSTAIDRASSMTRPRRSWWKYDRAKVQRAVAAGASDAARAITRARVARGKALLDRWLDWARRCRIPAFVELAARIVKHRDAIDAALEHRLSNGLVESTNTKIRLLTRMAFGFKSPEATIALAMLNLGGYCPPLPADRQHDHAHGTSRRAPICPALAMVAALRNVAARTTPPDPASGVHFSDRAPRAPGRFRSPPPTPRSQSTAHPVPRSAPAAPDTPAAFRPAYSRHHAPHYSRIWV